MFNNLKIGVRLGLGFAFVLLMLAAISILSITRINELNAGINDLAEGRIPKIVMADELSLNVQLIGRGVRNMIMTTLRSIVGEMELDHALSQRDMIKARLKAGVADEALDWGLTVKSVEIQDIKPSESMQRAMELQAAAERGARHALADVGLDGPDAANDIRELRNLLDAFNEAKKTAGLTLVKMLVTGLVLALLAGTIVKIKLFGGPQ